MEGDLEIDEKVAKESEMIRMGVGEDESGSVSRCWRQLKYPVTPL